VNTEAATRNTGVDGDRFTCGPHAKKWFATKCTVPHRKLRAIPARNVYQE